MPDLNQMVQNLKNALNLQGPIDEGTDGSHGPILGTGDTYNYVTYPETATVIDGGNGAGSINYPYTCRQRHKHYVAQAETATSDRDIHGVVEGHYDFTFTGKVLMSGVSNHGKEGRSGNAVENHMNSLNGANVG
jgi:hypothetical protein